MRKLSAWLESHDSRPPGGTVNAPWYRVQLTRALDAEFGPVVNTAGPMI